jgi:hypothetical protein
MWFNFLISFIFIVCKCWNSEAFLSKEIHIPYSSNSSQSIHFCTTRTLCDGSLKISLLEQLKQIFKIKVFIETGTYLGDTTIKGAKIFDEVHTIELSLKLYLKALQRLKTLRNVSVYLGDSSKIFPKLLLNIDYPILFYLDGHYSGHVTAKGSSYTPLVDELNAIASAKKENSVILIDDIRLFQGSLFQEKILTLNLGLETYPSLERVVQAILNINPSYQICFLGDALLAFPGNLGISISPVMRSCALHRLEHLCFDLSKNELEEADLLISKAKFQEKKEIEIYYQTYSLFELDYGYRCYGCFWQALVLLENGDEEQARFMLEKAATRSLPNWSIERWANCHPTHE